MAARRLTQQQQYQSQFNSYGTIERNFAGGIDQSNFRLNLAKEAGFGWFGRAASWLGGQIADVEQLIRGEGQRQYQAHPSTYQRPAYDPASSYYQSQPLNFTRTLGDNQYRNENYLDEINRNLQAYEDELRVGEDEYQDNNYPAYYPTLNFEIERDARGKEKDERNYRATNEQNILDSIKQASEQFKAPAIIQTLFQQRQASTYLPSTVRNRGATGELY